MQTYDIKKERRHLYAPKSGDFEVIDVDEDGNWLPPRAPVFGEFGPSTKIWAGTIVNVNGERAKSFDKHSIGKRVENYD